MSKKENTTDFEYEISSSTQKGKLSLPSEGVNELLKATSRLIDSVRTGAETVGTMLKNSTNTLGKPIEALINGKTNEIELANQFITARLMYVKETNATMHLAYVVDELNKKVKNGEKIPEEIEKSDNLFLIQENASTTSNEDFLKLWAKLYTEEVCKPGCVSRKTIKTVGTLDINIVKILENEIFPFCDDAGFYWGKTTDITSLLIAQDYGFIDDKHIVRYSLNYTNPYAAILNSENILYVHPGMGCCPKSHYILTNTGLEIKKLLKIYPKRPQIKYIIKEIEKSEKYWNVINPQTIRLKIKNSQMPRYVICNKKGKIKYPKNISYKNLSEYITKSKDNIEVTNV